MLSSGASLGWAREIEKQIRSLEKRVKELEDKLAKLADKAEQSSANVASQQVKK